MRKKLIPMEGGMAVVFDTAVLEIIGVDAATELELSTDGRRLILSPVGPLRTPASAQSLTGTAPASLTSESVLDCRDPKATVQVIEALQQRFGFGQEQFRQLHHFGPKASLQAHLKYCRGTGRFTSDRNVTVCRRLQLCLSMLQGGAAWAAAIARATKEHPFPPQH